MGSLARSGTRSTLPVPLGQPRVGAYSVFDALFRCDRYTHLPLPFPIPSRHPDNLATLHIYVCRPLHPAQITHQITHQPHHYPAMRACACVMQTFKRSTARFFFLPTPPSSLANSHPARATMTFKSPILSPLPHFLPHLLPSPIAIYAPVPLWADGRRSDYTVRPRRFCQARTRVPARYSILVSVSRCGVQHGKVLRAARVPIPDPKGISF